MRWCLLLFDCLCFVLFLVVRDFGLIVLVIFILLLF